MQENDHQAQAADAKPDAVNISATQPEDAPAAEALLQAAETKSAEYHDAWLRARAETENMRRRAVEDVAKAGKFAAEKFASEMLTVKDSLEAALASQEQDAATLRAGVELTLKQLVAAFDRSSLKEINPQDEKFDPHRHQAISHVEADGEPNRIIDILQKGYALHDRVLRPALVVVAKARGATIPPAA